MADYTIQGKTFRYPDEITNRRVIEVNKIPKRDGILAWYMDEQAINDMMRLLVEGPHDQVDWMEVTQAQTLEIYDGFFAYCVSKIRTSE